MSDSSHPSIVDFRRDLHQYPEAGWKEFRTTALVADELAERDFTLHLGTDAVAEEERLGVPPEDELLTAIERARREGAPERYLDRMDGVTGLVAEKTYGDGIGPVVGIRVVVRGNDTGGNGRVIRYNRGKEEKTNDARL